ncbi:porin [Burkholderia sp. BCCIQ04A]|uniref:Porin n=2 Tax=Burkholderiaceae TaxID=119060 RepID=A0ABU5WJE2_9BURK|nr:MULTISPECIES: porin [Burkholderia]MEB2507638.1 porin [Burkholderia anthinoferrum]MEB2532006.1 porin [Burkholderia anthinoferrum]MEB2562170.1 porin [Burkholderia anthinoferrum]MEB2578820.1 porin [Burkholderia anthinoferrum]MCA8109381.1 porin [Burkholderia sp. AU36459]
MHSCTMNPHAGARIAGTVIAACLTGFVPDVALAQSSVTLYGLIDTSITYSSNQRTRGAGSPGGGSVAMTSGALNASRWGLHGREDLGGGMAAVFTLENGFSGTTGKLSQKGVDLFGRQAWIGVGSETAGTLSFGRQYDLILDFVTPLGAAGPGWGGNLAVHPYDNDDSNRNLRVNNAVKYTSPTVRGLRFGAMIGFSNTAGQFSNNAVWSTGVSYANGPLKLGAGYLKISRDRNASNPDGALSTVDGSATVTGGNQQIWAMAGRYAFGPHSVGVAWSHSTTDGVTGVLQGGNIAPLKGESLVFDNFSIDARYFVTRALTVAAAYTYTMGRFDTRTGQTRPKWNQVVAQADYALSKRTDAYLEGTYQRVSGGNGNPAFNATVWTLTPSANSNQAVVALGLRHKF